MLNKEYFNFLATNLLESRAKHIWIFILSSLVVFIVSSTLFVVSSIKTTTQITVDEQADFIVQRYKSGKVQETPQKWVDEFSEIHGVSSSTARIYGKHFYEPSETYFMIVGVDFFDENSVKSLKTLFKDLDISDFLSKDNMLVGSGVKELFDYYEYKGYYNFRPPDRSIKKVYIYDVFEKNTQIVTNDIIIMDIDLAREILGVSKGFVTDIEILVANPLELEMIRSKLIVSHFDIRIISKEDISKHYENLFNYKGGVFLALYILSLVTFLLILYQRYSTVLHSDAKEIAILRVSGWSISDVIWFKLKENFIIAISSYMSGVIMAFIYVYMFNAPLIKEIFLGYNNLKNSTSLPITMDLSILFLIFLIFVIPFMLVVLIPTWKIAITEPVEVMR